MVSMDVDILAVKVAETAAATTDVAATAVMVMASEAPERASVDAVDVAATPTVWRPVAMEIAQVALVQAVAAEAPSAAVAKEKDKEYEVWYMAVMNDTWSGECLVSMSPGTLDNHARHHHPSHSSPPVSLYLSLGIAVASTSQ